MVRDSHAVLWRRVVRMFRSCELTIKLSRLHNGPACQILIPVSKMRDWFSKLNMQVGGHMGQFVGFSILFATLFGSLPALAVECPAEDRNPRPGQPETTTAEFSIPVLWKGCRGRDCFRDEDGIFAECYDLENFCYKNGVPTRCSFASVLVFKDVPFSLHSVGNISCDLKSLETSGNYSSYSFAASTSPEQSYCVVNTQMYNGSKFVPFRIYVR